MTTPALDQVLEQMPRIAEAVNAFASPEVQKEAFTTIARAYFGGSTEPLARQDTATGVIAPLRKRASRSSESKARNGKGKHTPSIVKELNLRPSGARTFAEFAEEKAPPTLDAKNVVAVYYLVKDLNLEVVTIDHVYTCYKDRSWRLPANLANSLQVTASRAGWLDTKDMQNIRLTIPGENVVEFDLPAPSVKK